MIMPMEIKAVLNKDNYYEIAGVIWNIRPQHDYTRELLLPYAVDADIPDAAIPAFREESPVRESEMILRAINTQLRNRFQGLLLHGAALIYCEKVYLFVAPSGTGKTTHIRLWIRCFGDQVRILNGDKPFLRLQNGNILVYGSPWRGKERLGHNAVCPLGGIYLLHRSIHNSIRPATTQEALGALLQATFTAEDLDGKLEILSILEVLCQRIPISLLHCNMETEAAEMVRRHIDKETRT